MYQTLQKLFTINIWVGIFCLGNMHFLCHFFVSFHGDLESKWAIGGPQKMYSVDKLTEESNGMALFLLKICSI